MLLRRMGLEQSLHRTTPTSEMVRRGCVPKIFIVLPGSQCVGGDESTVGSVGVSLASKENGDDGGERGLGGLSLSAMM